MSLGINILRVFGVVLQKMEKDCEFDRGVEMTKEGRDYVAYATESSESLWSGPSSDLVLTYRSIQPVDVCPEWKTDIAAYLERRGLTPQEPEWLIIVDHY